MVAIYVGAGLAFGMGVFAIRRLPDTARTLGAMIALGLILRALFLPTDSIWEDDHYRYRWDGGAVAAGLNPYAVSPSEAQGEDWGRAIDPAWFELAQDAGVVLDRVNYPYLRTIYPPVTQGFFALAHGISPWSLPAWRSVLMCADLVTLALLIGLLRGWGRSPLWAALYWCSPLAIKEIANSAHFEALLFAFILLALWAAERGRLLWASAWLGLAAGVKVWPLLLFPLLAPSLRTAPRAWLGAAGLATGVTALCLAPFALAGLDDQSGLVAYASGWSRNAFLFPGISALSEAGLRLFELHRTMDPNWLARGFVAATAALAALLIGASHNRPGGARARGAFLITAVVFCLSPAQYPWYGVWLLPLAALTGARATASALAVFLPAYYLLYALRRAGDETGLLLVASVEHAFILAALMWDAVLKPELRAPAPAPPAPLSGTKPQGAGRVAAILPARDEADALPAVLEAMPRWIDPVIVADNGSKDDTADRARAGGAQVVTEPQPGYGAACLAGIDAAGDADVLLFLDADGSDNPAEAERVVAPIARGEADLVIGARVKALCEPGALTPPQVWGNRLAAFLCRAIWGVRCTDLGPFRAISRTAYARLGMADRDFGWTIEMQAKAFRLGLRVVEVPVSRYHRAAGRSKVSGTLNGVLRAGAKILYVIGREAIRRPPNALTAPRPANAP